MTDVIIVGAGLSGLATAQELVEHGECPHTPSPRCHRQPRGRKSPALNEEGWIDLGGQWPAKQKQANLEEPAKQLGVKWFEHHSDGKIMISLSGRGRSRRWRAGTRR